jgi:hypothetical protein
MTTCLWRQEQAPKTLPVITRENNQNISHTKRNPTCSLTMVQDYPLTRPSPGANLTIYPSFPTLESRDLPEGRIPKSHLYFFFTCAVCNYRIKLTTGAIGKDQLLTLTHFT